MSIIKTLFRRLRKDKITHTIVTDKHIFPCYRSVEIGGTDLNGENFIMYVMDCVYKGKRRIITMDKEEVLFTAEDYKEDTWHDIERYVYGEPNPSSMIRENSIYG